MRAADGLKLFSKLKAHYGSVHVFSHPETLVEGAILIFDMFSWWNNVKKFQELADLRIHF